MSKFEVVRGVEGFALYLDDTRVAGQKPWGGDEVAIRWETHEAYARVNNDSRWFELFGTPERAARTMVGKCGDCCECVIIDYCRYGIDEGCLLSCAGNYDELLEWLKGDA